MVVLTITEVWEEVGEEIIGEDPNVAFDVVIEYQSCRDGRLVLSPSPPPFPMWHSHMFRGGHRSDRQTSRVCAQATQLTPHYSFWETRRIRGSQGRGREGRGDA